MDKPLLLHIYLGLAGIFLQNFVFFATLLSIAQRSECHIEKVLTFVIARDTLSWAKMIWNIAIKGGKVAIGVKVKKANFTSVPEVIVERTNRLPYNLHPLNSFLRNLLTLTSSILSLTTLGKQIRNSCAFKKKLILVWSWQQMHCLLSRALS